MHNLLLTQLLEEKQKLDTNYQKKLIDLAFQLNNHAFSSFNTKIEKADNILSFFSTNFLFCMKEKENFITLIKLSFSFSTKQFSNEPDFIKIIKPSTIKLQANIENLKPEDFLNLVKTTKKLEIQPIYKFESTCDFLKKLFNTYGKNSSEFNNWKSFGELSPSLGQYTEKKTILLHSSLIKVLSENLLQEWQKKLKSNTSSSLPAMLTDIEADMQTLFLKNNLEDELTINNETNKKYKI